MKLRNAYSFILALTLLLCNCSNPIPRFLALSDAKFSTGDNPEWKTAEFDDSQWRTIKTGTIWDRQGYADYDGFAWYRIRFDLPHEMLDNSYLKEQLQFYLAKIDDADETYLNGKLIGKTGSFPNDPDGYVTRHFEERTYSVPVDDPSIHWGGENILAIRVYDDNREGGICGGMPTVRLIDLIDKLEMSYSFEEGETSNMCTIRLVNNAQEPQVGKFSYTIRETNGSKVSDRHETITIKPNETIVRTVKTPMDERLAIHLVYKDSKTGKTTEKRIVAPYILTPPAPDAPRINGPKVYGVRPGSPVIFRIPTSGQKPIDFEIHNLPVGLTLDAEGGIIRGTLFDRGEYRMTITAKNRFGSDKREFTVKVGDLIALTPPMGWNSWNCWGGSVTDEKVRSSAQAMLDKGLVDYGYAYVNIDDAWQAKQRSGNGILNPGPHFPDMLDLSDWLHGEGLKMGIYSSPGPYPCDHHEGSYGYEKLDAETYAAWGVDYLKYDWCGYDQIFAREGIYSRKAFIKPYELMRKYLRAQPRDIVYSLCQYGMDNVWEWGADVDGNCWRTTGDIVDTWESMKEIGFNQDKLYPYAGPGRWNDPDMLIVGMVGWSNNLRPTRLTVDEQYTHITLWSLLSAPFLLGCDVSRIGPFTLSLLTNSEVIDVNQDALGRQAQRVYDQDDIQIWVKELENGAKAVGIFNLSEEDCTFDIPFAKLGLTGFKTVRDLWRQVDVKMKSEKLEVFLPTHGCAFYTIH